MEDVIFSGSSARQPVGVAEVTLVLDNSDHVLPVDFNEVAVTRRMYRSGESEYLINSSPCRLMDIQDILHDSGLGKDTHSIISQGKLDAILQSRPEERRALIEEAAGISKHKRRKERALKKIASMDEHLTRARDINREISRQLKPLERQVDRARKYKDLSSRARELTQILAVDELRRLQASWNDMESAAKEADASLELARYRLAERSASSKATGHARAEGPLCGRPRRAASPYAGRGWPHRVRHAPSRGKGPQHGRAPLRDARHPLGFRAPAPPRLKRARGRGAPVGRGPRRSGAGPAGCRRVRSGCGRAA